MQFKGQHILSTEQFDREGIIELFEDTKRMEKGTCNLTGKVLATLFYEPSTRTRFSFEAAMLKALGGVISNADMMETSSAKKRESLKDTGRTLSQMADVIVMRHPDSGSVKILSEGSEVPVINGGDGSNQHPTQALLDLYTVWKERGSLNGLTWGMIGDLRYSRVFHSQACLLKHFDTKFILVSPPGLEMPEKYTNENYITSTELKTQVKKMDIISTNRIQEERFESIEDAQKYRGAFVINSALLDYAQQNAILLNPLPRVDEIDAETDADPRAKYFEQVKNGVYIRMALINKVLNG